MVLFALVFGFSQFWTANEQGRTADEEKGGIPRPVSSFSIRVPPELTGAISFAFSSDSSNLVLWAKYFAKNTPLYLRPLDAFDDAIRPIPGTEGAFDAVFSPDGKWIAYAKASSLIKVNVATGVSDLIYDGEAMIEAVDWPQDGGLIFSMQSLGLWRVLDSGGAPEQLTTLDQTRGEVAHLFPKVLPDGKSILFTIRRGNMDSLIDMALLSLDTGTSKILRAGASAGRYISSGHLVYGLDGMLWATAFDLDEGELRGESMLVTTGVEYMVATDRFAIGEQNGSLAYVAGMGKFAVSLFWADRAGQTTLVPIERQMFGSLNISPDGRHLAVSMDNDIWKYDLARGAPLPIAEGVGNDSNPLWSPDGEWIAYRRSDGLYRVRDALGAASELILAGLGAMTPNCWTPDGETLIFTQERPSRQTGGDIVAVNINTKETRTLLGSASGERQASLSPDGRRLAFTLAVSGRPPQVWVQPYPDADAGAPLPISSEGASSPVWSRDGRELFMLGKNRASMWAVDVPALQETGWGLPVKLFDWTMPLNGWGLYDVAPDGRFLFGQPTVVTPEKKVAEIAPTEIRVVLNWAEELKRLLPVEGN